MQEKKPIYKKWWFWVIIILIILAVGNNTNKEKSEPVLETSEVTPEASGETSVNSQEELRQALKDKTSMSFSSSVRNDKTGKWRLGKYAASQTQAEIAADYYNAYFTSDDEIHYVINFSTKTTARITKISEDKLEVYITEYVDKEEHDAAMLGSGMELSQYFVTISTGEIERIEG